MLTGLSLEAQINTEIKINHYLDGQAPVSGNVAQNNLGNDFKVDRLEYYVSRITVVHDGGQVLPISDDSIMLVNPLSETSTTLELGTLNITNIESVKFHIGVFAPINNGDPSLWPTNHPLSFKSPSMHWGWASGYKFVAFEGTSGANFGQTFQFHGLDSVNYFETSVNAVYTENSNGTLVMHIDANYENIIQDIDVSAGASSHGSTGDAKVTLENFRDFVFASTTAVGIQESINKLSWEVYPNPSGESSIQVGVTTDIKDVNVIVTNTLGQVISSNPMPNNGILELTIEDTGIYFITLEKNDKLLSTKKFIRR